MCKDKQNLDTDAINSIKRLITGLVTKEEVCEYILDEETGKMKLIKQKVKKNTIPPNTDIIKLVYGNLTKEEKVSSLTDEELNAEKERLIKQLKEKEDDS